MQVLNIILNNICKGMYDAKGIILKQKQNCRWHMTTIKSYSSISRFKSIFTNTVPKLSKDKFCDLGC